MKKLKKNVANSYFAVLYQLVCVPLLTIFSFMIYDSLVLNVDYSSVSLNMIVLTVLVLANITLVYLIAKLFVKKAKMPLVYHVVAGAITALLIFWVNVYYQALEVSSCSDFSATTCASSIINGKIALLCLIAFIAYYIIYILIHKIVQGRPKQKAVA